MAGVGGGSLVRPQNGALLVKGGWEGGEGEVWGGEGYGEGGGEIRGGGGE